MFRARYVMEAPRYAKVRNVEPTLTAKMQHVWKVDALQNAHHQVRVKIPEVAKIIDVLDANTIKIVKNR